MQAEAALRQAELIRDGPIHEAVAWVGRRAGNKGMCVCVCVCLHTKMVSVSEKVGRRGYS